MQREPVSMTNSQSQRRRPDLGHTTARDPPGHR
jgi:hypothetical protein